MTRAPSNPDYEVGYGRPPRDHRFKPTQSGNKKGRPKRNPVVDVNVPLDLNLAEMILAEAGRMITVRDGGRVVEMSLKQALLRSTLHAAAQGDRRAQSDVIKLIGAAEHALGHKNGGATGCPRCDSIRQMSEEELFEEINQLITSGHLRLPAGAEIILIDDDDFSDLA